MKLTLDQFIRELPQWYRIWAQANANYFPLEKRLSEKAQAKGYLDIVDLADITRVLGNPYSIRSRMQRNNTQDSVIEKTKNAIISLDSPIDALKSICSIKFWGLTYGDLSPENSNTLN